jgi:hypothetical protein
VDDSADHTAHNVSLGVGADGFGFISGLGATVRYAASDVNGVFVDGPLAGSTFTITNTVTNAHRAATVLFGDGADIFNVQGTLGLLTINAGPGATTVNVGSAANTLDPIQGQVNVNGRRGVPATLNINDQGSTTPHTYTQTATTFSRSLAATITFTNITTLNPNKGPVAGSAPQAQGLTLTKLTRLGRPATLSGSLVDADPDAELQLTVDWGDGSRPLVLQPGLDPFSLQHHYRHAGTYTVRVIWTDLANGESNSRDLAVRVLAGRAEDGPPGAAAGPDAFAGLDAALALLAAKKDRHDQE